MTTPVLLHILYYKFRSFSKITLEVKTENILKNAASLIVFGGFTVGAYVFSREITSYVLDKVHLGTFLLHRFISMVLYVFFLSINIGNIIVAYAALYRSNETIYYLTKPVSYTTLFIVKFLDTFFYSSTTLFLVALAVLGGYGSHFHLPWTFYLYALVFLFVPFMLLSASLGVMALLLLMKLARVLGIKAIFSAVVLGYVSTIYFYFSMTNPVRLVTSVMKYYPYVDRYFGFLDAPVSKFVPSYWVAESLYWSISGNMRLAATNALILLVVSATALAAMCLLAKMLYYETWLTSMDLRALGEARASRKRFYSFSKKPIVLESQLSVLMKKEFWQFFREPSQWIHLGVILMLILIFIGSIREVNIKLAQPFMQTVSYLVIYIFNAFLISSIALRFVYPIISTEGPAFWSIRSAPITTRKFYGMKFFFTATPIILIGESLVIASHQPLAEYHTLMIVAVVSLLFVMLAFIGMNLSFGAYFSHFKESNPIKVASSQGATLTFLFTILFLIFLVAALVFPLQQYFEAIIRGWRVESGNMYAALVVIVVTSIAVLAISTAVGMRSLRRDL